MFSPCFRRPKRQKSDFLYILSYFASAPSGWLCAFLWVLSECAPWCVLLKVIL
nr:MAG TPA: hypothetical protein [Caudoviricetes sp.]